MLDLAFLDANIIFSAAYRPTTELLRLWSLPDLVRLTYSYAVIEVQRNLPPIRHDNLQFLLQTIILVPTPSPGDRPLPPALDLPAKDVPIFQAAAAADATHLLTGDKRHFGAYYGQHFDGVLIITPGAYLQLRMPCGG